MKGHCIDPSFLSQSRWSWRRWEAGMPSTLRYFVTVRRATLTLSRFKRASISSRSLKGSSEFSSSTNSLIFSWMATREVDCPSEDF